MDSYRVSAIPSCSPALHRLQTVEPALARAVDRDRLWAKTSRINPVLGHTVFLTAKWSSSVFFWLAPCLASRAALRCALAASLFAFSSTLQGQMQLSHEGQVSDCCINRRFCWLSGMQSLSAMVSSGTASPCITRNKGKRHKVCSQGQISISAVGMTHILLYALTSWGWQRSIVLMRSLFRSLITGCASSAQSAW